MYQVLMDLVSHIEIYIHTYDVINLLVGSHQVSLHLDQRVVCWY